MTPLGHLSVSIVTGHSIKRLCIPALMVGGILPDIDFIFLFSDFFNQIHRVATHNIFFIIFLSLVAMIVASKDKKTVLISMLIGGALHLFIDSCMDNNPTNGVGIALLWPLTDDFYSPFNILNFTAASHGWNEPLEMLKTLVPNMIYEVPFYFLAAYYMNKKRSMVQACRK